MKMIMVMKMIMNDECPQAADIAPDISP